MGERLGDLRSRQTGIEGAADITILERIVAADCIRQNQLVPEGRQGLIDFFPVI